MPTDSPCHVRRYHVANRRRGILRLTLDGLGELLELPEGIRVCWVQAETALTTHPNDLLVLLEDTGGTRLPMVEEGCVIPVVECPRAEETVPHG